MRHTTPSYRVDIDDARTHVFRVTLSLAAADGPLTVSLPVWIPGSYMVREFGRHLFDLQATQAGRPVAVQVLDKTTWRLDTGSRGAVRLEYRVYAFDTSVRTAYLDSDRAFFNNTSLCLRVHGAEGRPHRLRIGRMPTGWQVATAMAPAAAGAPDARGIGTYEAADYDELVDHPFELGPFWRGHFEACGIPHELVVSGALPAFDGERLMADTRRICEAQLRLWHGDRAAQAAPFSRYVFLLNTVEDGYGGLEHRASTALLASRRDLPRTGQGAAGDALVQLLGLISHEYFHAWNVKRLKPAELARLDYSRENYTRLLWFFEGFTSYYDDLMLRRCGLIDTARYLKLLTRTVQTVQASPGQRVQSVAEASFDAWVKHYRQDENTPNATISYYAKGSLVALCLDAALRDRGSSLDTVMRALWHRSEGGPLTEEAILAEVAAAGGPAVARDLSHWVHAREALPLAQAAARLGLALRDERMPLAQALGLKLAEGPISGVQVKGVLRDSAAEAAGLQAGDELLAVDDWRIRRLDDAQAWARLDQGMTLLVARDQRVRRLTLQTRGATEARQWALHEDTACSAARRRVREAWLSGTGEDAPARTPRRRRAPSGA